MNVLDRPPVPPASSDARVPVFVPYVGVDTLKHLTDALVVGTNTGTAALHIALLAAGIGPGDEVITPSFNYVADHQAIRATGAEPVMCDVRDDDLGIDVASAASLIGPRTKALVPLHFSGIPCRIADVYALARRHGLRVIEDACHAFGSTVDG